MNNTEEKLNQIMDSFDEQEEKHKKYYDRQLTLEQAKEYVNHCKNNKEAKLARHLLFVKDNFQSVNVGTQNFNDITDSILDKKYSDGWSVFINGACFDNFFIYKRDSYSPLFRDNDGVHSYFIENYDDFKFLINDENKVEYGGSNDPFGLYTLTDKHYTSIKLFINKIKDYSENKSNLDKLFEISKEYFNDLIKLDLINNFIFNFTCSDEQTKNDTIVRFFKDYLENAKPTDDEIINSFIKDYIEYLESPECKQQYKDSKDNNDAYAKYFTYKYNVENLFLSLFLERSKVENSFISFEYIIDMFKFLKRYKFTKNSDNFKNAMVNLIYEDDKEKVKEAFSEINEVMKKNI
jgi:hypothetical protein